MLSPWIAELYNPLLLVNVGTTVNLSLLMLLDENICWRILRIKVLSTFAVRLDPSFAIY